MFGNLQRKIYSDEKTPLANPFWGRRGAILLCFSFAVVAKDCLRKHECVEPELDKVNSLPISSLEKGGHGSAWEQDFLKWEKYLRIFDIFLMFRIVWITKGGLLGRKTGGYRTERFKP